MALVRRTSWPAATHVQRFPTLASSTGDVRNQQRWISERLLIFSDVVGLVGISSTGWLDEHLCVYDVPCWTNMLVV